MIFKHRSFFSYLGPHRYASTAIPWGHCLLSDEEYKEYADTYHKERSNLMKEFYFEGLSYPRMCISDLIKLCTKNGLTCSSIKFDKPKYAKLQNEIIKNHINLIDHSLKLNPNLSFEEMTSGLITIIFEKL